VKAENLDAMNGGWLGVFIAQPPNEPLVEAAVAWRTEQSGGAPDSHCLLSGAPSGSALTSTRTVAHELLSADDRWRCVVVTPLAHRTVR
jgi:hypothetical protein